MEDDGFVKVTYRAAKYRKTKKLLETNHQVIDCPEHLFASMQKDSNTIINNINRQRISIFKSEFYRQFYDLFAKVIKSFETFTEKSGYNKEHIHENVNLQDIVCYGLGSFSTPVITCSQMALLLLIRESSKCSDVFLYDPRFTELDSKILNQLNCVVIERNEEGKRKIRRTTIFYLPHCGRPLYNSILWANWTPENLSKIVIIGNSLTKFATEPYPNVTYLQTRYSYLFKVLPAVIEYNVPNTFHPENIFNNFTIIKFDAVVLQTFSEDIWQNVEEPFYDCDDEIILKYQITK